MSAHGNIFDQVRKFFHGVVFSRQILRSQQTRKVLLSNLTDEEEWHEVGSRHARTRRSQLSLADSCVRLVSGCQLSQWLRMSWSSSRRQRWVRITRRRDRRCAARPGAQSRAAVPPQVRESRREHGATCMLACIAGKAGGPRRRAQGPRRRRVLRRQTARGIACSDGR